MESGTVEQFDTDTLMREIVSRTYRDMWNAAESAAREIVEQYAAGDYDDAVTEWADGLVPVYYSHQWREWYAIGMPDGGEIVSRDDVDVWAGVCGALFEWYHGEIMAHLERLNGGN